MGDDELAEIRRQRMMQMQQQQMAEQDQIQRQQQMQAQIQSVLMQVMEPEARERLNTIRLTKPEFAASVEQQIVSLAQSGRLRQKITDEQLRQLLTQIVPQKKEFNIRRVG
ncbi:DNA-binding protein [Methanocorpusculum labreanum]|jgi:programmed cell death protein 5|uniref:DNA-binding protein Mlab_1482 n=1 Tax=Methanocorpusculum labreanum (strain ATCC 43576 / DSM 4855 / Z) TaxID=410358 RepID=Y1482_METLZ|nr:DNA-binding protein [Methanocorpusculum labreanum]A2STJ1.1 RecName: Full=DNA-binding protein Mlab_1482 [Methanocorpusculum labreanum Z]ABN07647.1 DNA-binding TFAR19-related protein [Methanocorpusculum labreanum Z]